MQRFIPDRATMAQRSGRSDSQQAGSSDDVEVLGSLQVNRGARSRGAQRTAEVCTSKRPV